MSNSVPTRQRLIDAAMRLFADKGFDSTSVGEIEEAVGLEPRRGGLYKHFPSKQALLNTAVRAKLDDARAVARKAATFETAGLVDEDPTTLLPVIISVGRWFLGKMDDLEDLTRVFEHDALRLVHLIDEVRTELVDLSYRSAAELIRAMRPDIDDVDATAVIMLSPLVTLRRTQWTYSAPPLGIDDDRFLAEWANQTLATLQAGPRPTRLRDGSLRGRIRRHPGR